MKQIRALMVLVILFAVFPAHAALDTFVEETAMNTSCDLTEYQAAVRDQKWNELAMRHFMVSLNSPDDHSRIQKVQREVDAGLEKLRREFGTDCVLQIQ